MIKHELPAKEITALEVQEQKWGELAPLSPMVNFYWISHFCIYYAN